MEKLPNSSITVVESALRARVPVLRLRYYDMQARRRASRFREGCRSMGTA